MQNTKDICRLCFTALDSGFELIGDYMKGIFEVLLLNVNLSVSENPIICEKCAELAQRAFTFKNRCISTEEIILSYAVAKDVTSLDMKWIYHMKMASEVTEENNVCRFCMTCIGEGNYLLLENIKCLPEGKLEEFLPEIKFNVVQPVVCITCLELLVTYFNFASTCASVEETINKYCGQDGTKRNGFVNLNDVVDFSNGGPPKSIITCNEITIKESLSNEDDSIFEKTDIKIEEHEIKSEIVDFLSEPGHSVEDSKYGNLGNGEKTQHMSSDSHMHEPNRQTFKNEVGEDETDYQCYLNGDVPVHETTAYMEPIKRRTCEIKVKYKSNTLVHSSEAFNYNMLEFETNYNFRKVHLQRHKNILEVARYKCCKCEYNTKYHSNFTKHSLVHKTPSEVTMYNCSKCEYKTKYQRSLKRHSLMHKNALEVTMYKCCKCDFMTKYQDSINYHSLVHKNASEATMYKCSKCEFKTKHKTYLKPHSLIHKKTSEVTMYKCCECKYKTKHQSYLKSHSLVHKNASEVTMYQCSKCEFKTKYQCSLKKHAQRHKNNIL